MVGKRARDDEDNDGALPPAKREKSSYPDRLSRLSDELILRVLSFLPVSQLVTCQRYVNSSPVIHYICSVAEISDCRTNTTYWREIVNYGRATTTIASYGLVQAGFLASKTWNSAQTTSTSHPRRQDGWRTSISSEAAERRIGRDSISFDRIGQKVVVR
jgi:hypothetical protein